jgi:hypothetical protein
LLQCICRLLALNSGSFRLKLACPLTVPDQFGILPWHFGWWHQCNSLI